MFTVEETVATERSQQAAMLDCLLALIAVGALTATVLLDLPVRSSPFAASDLKTLYASAWCFRHGLDAYSFHHLQMVFQQQGIAPPPSWFGHAPVYPPTTLALLAPLTLLSMSAAAYATIAISALLFACAVAALLRYAAGVFKLAVGWRVAIAGLCAAGPLLAFALSMGNLSVAASALAILAFVRRGHGSVWGHGILLALAVLLKPHLAVWMLLGMLALPERRARGIALRAAVVATVGSLFAAKALARGQLLAQTHSFFTMIAREMAPGGSMNLSSREPLPVLAQITSLPSVLGFWTPDRPLILAGAGLILLALLAALIAGTRRVHTEGGASLAVGAWCAFGLLTTYHRAHDAIVLLVLLPWMMDRLRQGWNDWAVWALLVLYAGISVGPAVSTMSGLAASHRVFALPTFLGLRQAGMAGFGLVLMLVALLYARRYDLRQAGA